MPVDVPRVPPPWRLRGNGYFLLFSFKPGFLRAGGFLPPELEGADDFEGQLGVLMLVEYLESPVGPYHELLFLAGRDLRWRHHRFSITRIYVSTEASAVNGRENWGIPKQMADFQVIRKADGTERAVILLDGFAKVDLTVAPAKGRAWPAVSALAPPSWRTITQFKAGQPLVTRLSGRGLLRPAKLLDFRTLPQFFPDVNEGEPVAGFRVADFRLRFPKPAGDEACRRP